MHDVSSSLAARLGHRRTVILHLDDLGATLGANKAFLDLAARGLVSCGSVMVPGPWFMHLVEAAAANPHLDIGVHLTLTSEWPGYRWAPLSTRSRASGLIDDDGYFWRDVASLRRHMVVEAAALELRTQVERAVAAGLKPTHLDAHMAVVMLRELLNVYIDLGEAFGMWPVLPRSIDWAPDAAAYRAAVDGLDRSGRPVADHCRGTLAVPSATLEGRWRTMIDALPSGVTHMALHATTPGDFADIAPDHAEWRFAEYALLGGGAVKTMLEQADIAVIGCREIQTLWREGSTPFNPSPTPISGS